MQKIRELVSILDQRKDESIERTFKGVARHFREVFSELVQGGHGHLVMMKKKVYFPCFPTDLASMACTFRLLALLPSNVLLVVLNSQFTFTGFTWISSIAYHNFLGTKS